MAPHYLRDEIVVAVPEARVCHPFWTNITRQVVGWALGDVLCLSQLPQRHVKVLLHLVSEPLPLYLVTPESLRTCMLLNESV